MKFCCTVTTHNASIQILPETNVTNSLFYFILLKKKAQKDTNHVAQIYLKNQCCFPEINFVCFISGTANCLAQRLNSAAHLCCLLEDLSNLRAAWGLNGNKMHHHNDKAEKHRLTEKLMRIFVLPSSITPKLNTNRKSGAKPKTT